MKKKGTILAVTYATAAILSLGIYAYVSQGSLADYRLAAKYSSSRAFEETVGAVNTMSKALAKSVYATDGSMCGKICSEAYASAMAAEAAMATLPFSTQELEQISAFLNVAGDYTYTLCSEAAENGFTEEQVQTLTDMSARAAQLADTLQELRGSVNNGSILMDSREARLSNVGNDDDAETLSSRLLAYEQSLQPAAEIEYDGMYGASQKSTDKLRLTEGEMKTLAAEYAGVDQAELEPAYEYEGAEGRRSFWAGERLISVGPSGVESMSQSRLVGESLVSQEEALEIAKDYLRQRGFDALELKDSRVNGAVCLFEFCKASDEALCLDNTLSLSVALDDGSIYGFNAVNFDAEDVEAVFDISLEDAEATLPQGLELTDSRKVIIQSAGGRDQACYELSCTNENDRPVKIYVDASTGKQCRIEL